MKAFRVFMKPNGPEPGGWIDFHNATNISISTFMQMAKHEGGFATAQVFVPLDQMRCVLEIETELPSAQVVPYGPRPVA